MTDGEHVNGLSLFIDFENDPEDVGLLSIEIGEIAARLRGQLNAVCHAGGEFLRIYRARARYGRAQHPSALTDRLLHVGYIEESLVRLSVPEIKASAFAFDRQDNRLPVFSELLHKLTRVAPKGGVEMGYLW